MDGKYRIGFYLSVLTLLGVFIFYKKGNESTGEESAFVDGINGMGLYIDGKEKPEYQLRADTEYFEVVFGIGKGKRLINVRVREKGTETHFILSRFDPILLKAPSLRQVGDIVYLGHADDGEFIPHLLIKEELLVLSEDPTLDLIYDLKTRYLSSGIPN